MRIAVYGGSFNPPHLGHAMVASWVVWSGRADAVWLMPCASHAFAKDLADFGARLALCEALADLLGDRVRVCDVERDLPSPNYTWDTLCALRQANPQHDLSLVVGADTLEQVHLWHRWEDLSREFTPIVVGRQGYPAVEGAPCFPDISSSEVRELLGTGRAVDHLVPAVLVEHLAALYGPDAR